MEFKIWNNESGHEFGSFYGDSKLGAYQDMCTLAGYSEDNLPPGSESWDTIPEDISIWRLSR